MMRSLRYLIVSSLLISQAFLQADPIPAQTGTNFSKTQGAKSIYVVDAKRCLEESKLGKKEKANFDRMKNEMEGILQDKSRALQEIERKLNDDDYIDSISTEAETELKNKKRTLKNEGFQLQSDYYKTLEQVNQKIIQRVTESINKATEELAKENSSIDLVVSVEACAYFAPNIDISSKIIEKMDALFVEDEKKGN